MEKQTYRVHRCKGLRTDRFNVDQHGNFLEPPKIQENINNYGEKNPGGFNGPSLDDVFSSRSQRLQDGDDLDWDQYTATYFNGSGDDPDEDGFGASLRLGGSQKQQQQFDEEGEEDEEDGQSEFFKVHFKGKFISSVRRHDWHRLG